MEKTMKRTMWIYDNCGHRNFKQEDLEEFLENHFGSQSPNPIRDWNDYRGSVARFESITHGNKKVYVTGRIESSSGYGFSQ
jgi:hypothetical protein